MQKFKTILTNPANLNNPYEYIGINHNFIMSSLSHNFGTEIIAISDLHARQEFIKEKVNELTQYYWGFSNGLGFLDTVYGYNGLYSDADFENYKPIIENINISTQDQQILIAFFDNLTDGIALDDANLVSQAITRAYSLEMNIIKEVSTNNQIVLATTAIARYSLFWAQTNLNPDDVAAKKIKWQHVLADCVGGLLGGVLVGPGGILSGAASGTAIYYYCTMA
ncbi:MAG: hypothetical protein IM638_08680 [Bacteroidetes bacterium]|nr:hypothetical protein [Bacteroidota bacterium]